MRITYGIFLQFAELLKDKFLGLLKDKFLGTTEGTLKDINKVDLYNRTNEIDWLGVPLETVSVILWVD